MLIGKSPAKRGNDFWKCWNSKFSSGGGQCKQVDGFTDHQQIADSFEKHFVALGSVVQSNASCNMQYTCHGVSLGRFWEYNNFLLRIGLWKLLRPPVACYAEAAFVRPRATCL